MRLTDLYSASPETEQASQPASAATAPASQNVAATAVQPTVLWWLGLALALVLLRVVYELSE
jgi:hypothetical protein